MPKILKQKKLNRIPATIFKYVNKSKFYYVRFWVCKGYKQNGCHTQSLEVTEERLAEKEALKIYQNFNFKSVREQNKIKINKSKRDYHKDIAVPYFKLRELENPQRAKKELGQYNNEIKNIFQSIDYSNPSEMDYAVQNIFYNLSMKERAVATQRNYKIICTNQMNLALKNNNIPFNVMPNFPKLKGRGLRRLSYMPKEMKQIRIEFKNESKMKESMFLDETTDYLSTCEASAGARPGLELLYVRRNNISFINDPENPKQPIIKMTLLQTKKDQHKFTLADWWRDDVYPRILNRYPNTNQFDYLFFPEIENRVRLFDRIRKNFERISNNLGLFVKDNQNRPIYCYRHSFISKRRKHGVDANVVAIHSNTSVEMINQHYQDMSDEHLLDIHNKMFPERTKNLNHKVITKKP